MIRLAQCSLSAATTQWHRRLNKQNGRGDPGLTPAMDTTLQTLHRLQTPGRYPQHRYGPNSARFAEHPRFRGRPDGSATAEGRFALALHTRRSAHLVAMDGG